MKEGLHLKLSQERFKHLNHQFINAVNSKPFLIASHRGEWGGSILQNSVASGTVAHKFGAEIFELDVCQSNDGLYFGFHSGKEKEIFGEEIKIEEYTYKEIQAMPILNAIGEKMSQGVQLIDDIINNIPKDMFVQLDRSWFYWDTFLDHLDQYPDEVKMRLILKSPIEKDLLNKLDRANFKAMYMPIIHQIAQLELLSQYQNINYIGLEVIAPDAESELYGKEIIDQIHSDNQLIVQLNAIKLNDRSHLYAGFDDHVSLLESPDSGWAVLQEFGANIIQTDWTQSLANYRRNFINIEHH